MQSNQDNPYKEVKTALIQMQKELFSIEEAMDKQKFPHWELVSTMKTFVPVLNDIKANTVKRQVEAETKLDENKSEITWSNHIDWDHYKNEQKEALQKLHDGEISAGKKEMQEKHIAMMEKGSEQ